MILKNWQKNIINNQIQTMTTDLILVNTKMIKTMISQNTVLSWAYNKKRD